MSEIFERLCPVYMSYGMTYEQYWYGDPWSLRAYKDAHMLRRKERNLFSWLDGLYTYSALNTVLANAFASKGTPPRKYLEQPLDIFPKTEAEEQAEQERKRRELVLKLTAWKKMFDNAKKSK